MKNKIVAVVLALAGLALLGYGAIDIRDFGLELQAVYAIISGFVSLALAVVLAFEREKEVVGVEPETARTPRPVPERPAQEIRPRSGFVLAAAILAVIGVVLPGGFYAGNFAGEIGYSIIIDAIGGMFYAQFFWGLAGCVCLFVGYFRRARLAVLVGSICECLAAVCWLLWCIIYVLPIVFGFIGYAKMKKQAVRI